MFVCEGRATYTAAFDALSASAVRDPTNDRGPAPGHVFSSSGREYSDVPPLDGLYGGGQDFDSHAEVVVTRLR